MLFLFMLLSTLINQEGGRFYCKLQKMFILSRAMTISYMAYPSFQRKEKILRNSQGKLIFKAVGGRGDKKTNTAKATGTQSPAQPQRRGDRPCARCFPRDKRGFPGESGWRHLAGDKQPLPGLGAPSRAEELDIFLRKQIP